jgi:phage shock protein PspC (stress-responsive transcriptional regulator)
MDTKRLYRSYEDKKVGGVAAGIAEYFDIDPLLIRLLFVILTLAGGGGVLIYIILWIVTPEKPYAPRTEKFSNPSPQSEQAGSYEPKGDNQSYYQEPAFSSTEVTPPPPPRQRGSLIGGLVLITIGGLFLADELLPDFNFGDFWPVILIVIGGGLLIKAMSKKREE